MDNKRAYSRHLDKNVNIVLVAEQKSIIKGNSLNLSHDGICGVFEKIQDKNGVIDVELEFVKDNMKIKCRGKGKIIWAVDIGNNESLIGLNLLDFDKKNMKDYINYVDNIYEKI